MVALLPAILIPCIYFAFPYFAIWTIQSMVKFILVLLATLFLSSCWLKSKPVTDTVVADRYKVSRDGVQNRCDGLCSDE